MTHKQETHDILVLMSEIIRVQRDEAPTKYSLIGGLHNLESKIQKIKELEGIE